MLGHDCLEVCLCEVECEVGWFVPLVSVCQHLYIYLSRFRHHPSELRTKPRDLGVLCLCLIFECHTLLLFCWNVFRMSLFPFKVRILERVKEIHHYSQYCCLLKAVRFDTFLESKHKTPSPRWRDGSLVSHHNCKPLEWPRQ